MDARKLRALVDRDGAKKQRGGEPDREQQVSADKLSRVVEQEGRRVQDGRGDRKLIEFVRDNYDPEHNPPEWVTSESLWEKAKEAVDPEGEGADKYDEPYAVVAHVYKRMGGKIKGSRR